MAVQKTGLGGGRPVARGQRFLIWVILGVVCLVLFHFWTYEQTWSSDPSKSPESKKALKAMLMKSWFGLTDGGRIYSNRDLLAPREIFTLCNSSTWCAVPQRLLLYHWGKLVPSMGSWIDNVVHASFGRKLDVVAFENSSSEEPVCLEHAIGNRRGLGRMSAENINSMFETIRCRTRKYCQVVVPEGTNSHGTHMTLLLRSGARAFRDSTAVWKTLDMVCRKVGNCKLEVAYAWNLSFCEQVGLLSRTDVLVTTHGAQMTNMMFMSEGGSVMELIPKGCLEFAGIGQYVYSWLASSSNLHYELWRDPEGPDCPYPTTKTLKCLLFHKDLQVGHNETHLTHWSTNILRNFRPRRFSIPPLNSLDHAPWVFKG